VISFFFFVVLIDNYWMSVGWNVVRVGDANDLDFLERALKIFKNTTDRPTLIIVDSHIAYGAPTKQDTHAAHGEPLGEQGNLSSVSSL
jgi:transketolase